MVKDEMGVFVPFSSVTVSNRPPHTGTGSLEEVGAGTRFQPHMLMYNIPSFGP